MLPNIAVILTDAQRKILWVNEDFTEITGYTLYRSGGKNPACCKDLKPNRGRHQRIRRSLQHNDCLQEEITNYRKNGEPLFVQVGDPSGFQPQPTVEQLHCL